MKRYTKLLTLLVLIAFLTSTNVSAQNEYIQRFLKMYEKINDSENGYFSADGVPYHSIETLMCEAPDQGHETTSEAYSYWIWLNVMYGKVSGDWAPLNEAWEIMEATAIPTDDLQPTASDYSKATFAGEYPEPSYYPAPLEADVPVGEDPMSSDLTNTYGANIYGMHWLFDCDNFYGYGNKGDGVSTPSYINTFQRGEQESVWETVPHPSWEDFSWGSDDGTGFLKLFIDEGGNAPTAQWRYTNAPDADARVVQAMYWASQFVKEQGGNPSSVLPLDKASKMGDFIRLAMCDKYFKPIGVQDKMAAGGSGYESVHYLISWYYAWGGPLESNNWGWRIGCSHSHFGYQNPVAAYALSEYDELKPVSQNGVRDWGKSLDRQLEFYTWLQSAEGGIAGGATNSYNGSYDAYPSGTATFYDMAYIEQPVYHDPGSNEWFGMQAWSMERIAELYYISNDARAKKLLDKWVAWVSSEVKLYDDGTFEIPNKLTWSGQPNTWNPNNPTENSNLHVTVSKHSKDLDISACLAKALTYYAAATEKYGTLDTDSRDLAKEILDRMWANYYEEDGAGVAVEEERADYSRFFEPIHIPEGWSGKMANGDVIKPGVSFIDIRSNYKNDPDYAAFEQAYNNGETYKSKYHRFWGQTDIALANAEFGRFFGETTSVDPTSVSVSPSEIKLEVNDSETLTATVAPVTATNKNVAWSSSNTSVATVDSDGKVTAKSIGQAIITATTEVGSYTSQCKVTVVNKLYDLSITIVGPGAVSLSPEGGSYEIGTEVTLTATPESGSQFDGWSGDADGTATTVSITIDSDMSVTATFSQDSPCSSTSEVSLPYTYNGTGKKCIKTTDNINYVSSWNMASVVINNVDFTNTWSNSMPAKIDGFYYIYFDAPYNWSHIEITSSKQNSFNSTGLKTLNDNEASQNVSAIYPNPFNENINFEIKNPERVQGIIVLDQLGRTVSVLDKSDISTSITLGSNLEKGLYLIVVQSTSGNATYKVIKE